MSTRNALSRRASHLSVRTVIHQILAASALSAVLAQRANAACTDFIFSPPPLSQFICTGDLSGGIYTDDYRYQLYLFNLTTPIAPAQGTRGVNFFRDDWPAGSQQNPTLVVGDRMRFFWDGTQSITTRDAIGISIFNFIEPFIFGRAGDIDAQTLGGAITVSGTGAYDGISAISYGQEDFFKWWSTDGGNVTLDNRSTIQNNSAGGRGIFAWSWATYSGLGGVVHVSSNTSFINTFGNGGHGIFALSEGGYGPNGDSGINGGDGGVGGIGGNVLVDGSGTINTFGLNAKGVMAISRGGIGGTGGDAVGGSAGTGVYGGRAGTVTVDGNWRINTFNDNAAGIFAESLGGEGGRGGSGYLWSDGGTGGGSADGSTVTVKSHGNLTTFGKGSYGIFAHSVGGFAGSGGSSYGIVGYGGTGNSAGGGGAVFVENHGQIRTGGEAAHGIYAQSVGGGGGSGGNGGGVVAVGGGGAAGGDGGAVDVLNTNSIVATGLNSRGIFAQSVGGGGGDGGDSGGVAAIGGAGSGTSDGSTVRVDNSGSITSSAHAIFAESVGGGGGNGGSSTGWFSVGGGGGTGGGSDAVTVFNHGALTTTQNNSSAIFAHSIGGGGGNGGGSIGAGLGGAIAIGGDGAAGGNGANVTVHSDTGAISTGTATTGDGSSGIFAQSVGGGGGNGGFAFSGAVSPGPAVAIAMGGKGAGGGDGAQVEVSNGSSIVTRGNDANAIYAESLGGGGGSGGFAIAVTGGQGLAGSFAVGGTGSGGGKGDTVSVASTGTLLQTFGDRSSGLVAQSVGGGGGSGGFAVAGAFNISAGVAAAFGLGGNGGGGGLARAVTVDSSSNISTAGDEAHGLFAQSVGGGGGSGGFSVAGSLSGSSAVNAAFGGKGGGGGVSDKVEVGKTAYTTGTIHTTGDGSKGLFAQSVGGGGGSGGFAVAGGISAAPSVSLGVGGDGGTARDAAAVIVHTSNTIVTEGRDAHGLVAQSVGGGGGTGGFSVTGNVTIASGAVGAAIGGKGGGGGSADTVEVFNTGASIDTSGDRSYGLFAQSVGGGGGDGGFAVAGSVSQGPAANFAVGGSGSQAGVSKAVEVRSTSAITTRGNDSNALFAQSVGGGGGSGGFAVTGTMSASGGALGASIGGAGNGGGSSGTVTVNTLGAGSGIITTLGNHSTGILAQSVGGGGGVGGFAIAGNITNGPSASLSIGGNGGTGSDSDVVLVESASSVGTYGNDSHGIFAQSVGGGGGDGGFAVAGSVSATGNVNAAIGGSGNGGGNAKGVTLKSNGLLIATAGTHSYGLVAQSLGGGGGDGGFSVAGGISNGVTANLSIGGSGAGGGAGSSVLLESSTQVMTAGDDAHGVFAQSVGGGGGSGGFAITGGISRANAGASIGGSGDKGGDAGIVTLHNTAGLVRTEGTHAYGVIAQSIGGGGGDGGFSVTGGISSNGSAAFALGGSGAEGGAGKAVVLTSSSVVATQGADSHGLFAQSVGGGGGSGGFAVAGAISNNGAATAALGGSGAGGGDADAVTLTNDGTQIVTGGDRSYGIVAQSVGGGGGDGGFAVSGSITKGAAANFSMGGSGDKGGAGRDVELTSNGYVSTQGQDAHAIFAQSIGGGGGSGGFSVSGSIAADSGTVSASIGGGGDTGGKAGKVSLGVTDALDGVLLTAGDRAYGVLAQSVGGGGGDGGFSVAGGISKGAGAKFSLGGSAGSGSNADVVTVRSAASIQTLGDAAHGLFAQSVGGGGGSGGFSVAGSISTEGSSVNASIGGSGAGGGNGGAVDVASSGVVIATGGERAYGIVAQSIGGGGGDGGFSVAGSIDKQKTINFSLGGSGDIGGTADVVNVHSATNITTLGTEAHAIFAQSLGGGGGSGGFSVAGSMFTSTTNAPSIDASVGGSGAGGGDAGRVAVGTADRFAAGVIDTSGTGAHGIFAQSLGGGGGNGGFSVAGGLNKSPAIRFSLGGSAGTGSDGAEVEVFTGADITTRGDGGHGVFAQSLGGGGGNGGFSVAGSATQDTTSVNASIGGKGGGGGRGGDVAVDSAGRIITLGNEAYGVFGQSIGGGGGNGGFSVAGSLTTPPSGAATKKPANNIEFAMGGAGGSGDRGGDVAVRNVGIIDTLGTASHGILAQSVGGGGGTGGFAAAGSLAFVGKKSSATRTTMSVSLGGNGGAGNIGGAVSVDNSEDITTRGAEARGVYAYSVGGGGGNGGAAYAIDAALGKVEDNNGLNIEVAVGGIGGSGNTGGAIDVHNGGRVITLGDRGDAVFAQSVGGGGGDGGKAHSVSFDLTKSKNAGNKDPEATWNFTTAVGGNAGSANDGGQIDVTNAGNIETSGFYARGIVAQSVGGGGGSGGEGVQGTGIEGIDVASEFLDLRDKNVIDLRSWTITVGGNGGASGAGKDVHVTNSGSIVTHGLDAFAIFAQSIGGGGGDALNFAQGSGAGGKADSGINSKFAIGGGGGSSGNGGVVTVVNSNVIETFGHEAHGIFAQSVGGGGGVAGNVDRGFAEAIGPVPALNLGIGAAVGQDGGSAGNGGDVAITNVGSIFTHGISAYGILAQSVGGGGGAAAGLGNENTFAAPVLKLQNFYGSAGGDGDAGMVTVNQTGNIVTSGANAMGIFAQSVAADGVSKLVDITTNGSIVASGVGSFGVLAQSLGAQAADHLQSSGDIRISVNGGAIRGGVGAPPADAVSLALTEEQRGAGIRFLDGHNNTLSNRGTIGDVTDLTRMAVLGGVGNEAITNHGVLAGNFNLGAGHNTVTNAADGMLVSGLAINLGTGGALTNSGMWSIGHLDAVARTAVNGQVTQSGSGELLVDLDFANWTADRIDISGGNAVLAGSVVLNRLNNTVITPGTHQVTLLSASGGITQNLAIDVAPSPVTQYQLSTSAAGAASELRLTVVTDFSGAQTGAALDANEAAIGEYINKAQLAGSSAALAPVIRHLMAVENGEELDLTYQLLTPAGYAVQQIGVLDGNHQFGNALLSCRQADGDYHFVREGQCGWFAVSGNSRTQDARGLQSGIHSNGGAIAGGAQFAVSEQWHLGFGASRGWNRTATDRLLIADAQSSNGTTSQAGVVAKGNFGNTTLAVGVTAGRTDQSSIRHALFGMIASSDQRLDFTAVQVRLGQAYEMNRWYWRPLLDASLQRVHRDAFAETGSSATALNVAASTDTFLTLQPALEFGRDFYRTAGITRLYASLGASRLVGDRSIDTSALLRAAPAGVAPFSVSEQMDRTRAEVSAGVDLFSAEGVVLRFGYTGQFSAHTSQHGGSLKLSVPF